MLGRLTFCLLLCVTLHAPFVEVAHSFPVRPPSVETRVPTDDEVRFLAETVARIPRVSELAFLRAEAERLGVRVWLFGGTAAAFANYLKAHFDQAAGVRRFPDGYFDYHITSIYRPNQDFDIVVDGYAQQAKELQARLDERFPYRRRDKSAWEVRLLRQTLDAKEALLGRPDGDTDFAHQHTDSMSTGMVEVTVPPAGETAVRDLRAWDEPFPAFLEDVLGRRIRYYYSDSHGRTARAKRGDNPPILSVVRFLVKALQYDLAIAPEDLMRLKTIVDDFNPDTLRMGYVRTRLDLEARKLYQNTVSLERAWKLMDDLGLRDKLIALGDPVTIGSLSFWLSKKPLPSFPVGQGRGKTARELGLDGIAHETNNFEAFEQMAFTTTGEPNVFVSRMGAVAEAARYGEGFYTKKGSLGTRSTKTGFTLRLELDPNAREGSDFKYIKAVEYVVVLNRKAVKVVSDHSKPLDPAELFLLLAENTDVRQTGNAGAIERIRRRVRPEFARMDDTQKKAIAELGEKLAAAKRIPLPFAVEWLISPLGVENPSVARRLSQQDYAAKRQLVHELFQSLGHDIVETFKVLQRTGLLKGFSGYHRSLFNEGPWERALVGSVPELVKAGFTRDDLRLVEEFAFARSEMQSAFHKSVAKCLVGDDLSGAASLSERIKLLRAKLAGASSADDVVKLVKIPYAPTDAVSATEQETWHSFVETEALAKALALGAAPLQLRKLCLTATRFPRSLGILLKRAAQDALDAQEYLSVTSLTGLDRTAFHQAEAVRVIKATFDHFLSLSPTPEQVMALLNRIPNESVRKELAGRALGAGHTCAELLANG